PLEAFGITVALGAATEVAQFVSHRDPSVGDVLRDALGAAATLSVSAYLGSPRSPSGGRRLRAASAVIAARGLGLVTPPVIWCLAAYAHRDMRFPVLCDFESPLDLYFISKGDPGIRRTTAPAPFSRRANERALFVPLVAKSVSGVTLVEPYPDWRGKS